MSNSTMSNTSITRLRSTTKPNMRQILLTKPITLLFLLAAVLFFAFSNTAVALDDILILNSTTSLSGNPGATISSSFVVENRGDESGSGFVSFSGYTLTHTTASSRTISISSIDAVNTQNGSNTTVNFNIPIPSNQYAGIYRGNITATKGSATSQATIEVSVNASPASATLQSISVSTVAGTSASASSNLVNTGNVDISSVAISISDLVSGSNTIPSSAIAISPASIATLSYGQTSVITMSFSTSSSQAAGTYTGNLTAVFGSTRVTALVYVTIISPSSALSVSSTSATWSKGVTTSITKTITVQNTGNTNISGISITLSSVCSATMSSTPSSFSLVAGASQSLTITITGIPATQAAGSCTGSITATSGNVSGSGTITINVRDPTYSISVPSSVTLGSGTVARNTSQTGTFTITNDGDYELTINISTSASSTYQVTFSDTQFTLSAGSSKTITVQAFIPASQSSETQSIGDINVRYTSGQSSTAIKTIPLQVSTESKLAIYKVSAQVGTGSDDSVHNGGTIDDKARPGDSFQLEVTAQNTYGSGTDIDMDDIEIKVTVENLDDGSDVDKDASEFKLRPTKKGSKTLSFNVPEDTEENSFKIVIEVTGTDENGATHSATWNIYLDVERKEHDLRIRTFDFIDNSLECNERTASLRVHIENRGDTYEDEAAILMNQTQFGISIFDSFELDNDIDDDDSEFKKTYSVLLPSSIAPGNYVFTLWVYYDRDIPFDYKQATLTVESCGQVAGTAGGGQVSQPTATTPTGQQGQVSGQAAGAMIPTATDQSAIVILPSGQVAQPAGQAEAVSPVKFPSSALYIMLLAIGVLVAIGIIVAMMMSMRKQ